MSNPKYAEIEIRGVTKFATAVSGVILNTDWIFTDKNGLYELVSAEGDTFVSLFAAGYAPEDIPQEAFGCFLIVDGKAYTTLPFYYGTSEGITKQYMFL